MNEIRNVDVVIVGGGPAGLAAAIALKEAGIEDILVLEREKTPGGILRQCIHDGFGLTRFGETLSGPEYASRFVKRVHEMNISVLTNTTVLEITPDKFVYAASREGLITLSAKAIVLSMGCRERTRGALSIPGTRPSGIYTAGVAQSYINLHNKMVGKEVVILGSGDIGLIMARRLTLEGAHVIGVFEIQPYANGLPRNVLQCLEDYDIPLYLSHSVTDIKGEKRLEGVVVSAFDENLNPIPGTEKEYDCDTLILSVGLIPENELTWMAGAMEDTETKGALVDEYYQTNVEGIFAAGNVLHVHDLVDFVSLEAEALAKNLVRYLREGGLPKAELMVTGDALVGQLVPKRISGLSDVNFSFRVKKPLKNVTIEIRQGEKLIKRVKKAKALPAEMIQIQVEKESLLVDKGLEVCVLC